MIEPRRAIDRLHSTNNRDNYSLTANNDYYVAYHCFADLNKLQYVKRDFFLLFDEFLESTFF